MFQVKFSPNETKRLFKILTGRELARNITLDDCWDAYQSERKQAWTTDNLPKRHETSQFKLELISKEMHDELLANTPNYTLLDVGCGDGIIGHRFAKKYKLIPKYTDVIKAIVLDDADFTIFDPEKALPFKEQFKIISCFHILHHIPTLADLQFRLIDIHTRLQPKGYLIIKEHDVHDAKMQMKILWQHICYEIREIPQGMSKDELSDWIINYKLQLYSQGHLREIIENCGYVFINASRPSFFDGSYYALFMKK